MLRAPIPAVGWQPGSCTQNTLSSLRGLSGLVWFFFNFQNNSVYRQQTVVLGFVFLFFPQLPCTLRALRAQKRGCSSWRAHHPFTRSCHRNSAHTPTDVWAWNKSGSLGPRWLDSAGLRGVESSKISFQSIKICRDIWNVQREQISRVNQSND